MNNAKLNDVLHQIINLPSFEKSAKRYYEKYQQLEEYTGVKSISMDQIIISGEGKSYADIIMEKDKHYNNYLHFKNKVDDCYKMLEVLDEEKRSLIIDWYTTPKNYRKKADEFAKERGLSRRLFFYYKSEALKKLVEFNK
ncbi:MAG: hypothetical protein ACK5LC_11410 [Coprobacillaceae bacterium]